MFRSSGASVRSSDTKSASLPRSSKLPSLINLKNFLEPVTFVLSPTLTQLISVGKDFLGGGDSGDDTIRARDYKVDFDRYKVGTDSYGFERTQELDAPGQAAAIQQVSYKQTQI